AERVRCRPSSSPTRGGSALRWLPGRNGAHGSTSSSTRFNEQIGSWLPTRPIDLRLSARPLAERLTVRLILRVSGYAWAHEYVHEISIGFQRKSTLASRAGLMGSCFCLDAHNPC